MYLLRRVFVRVTRCRIQTILSMVYFVLTLILINWALQAPTRFVQNTYFVLHKHIPAEHTSEIERSKDYDAAAKKNHLQLVCVNDTLKTQDGGNNKGSANQREHYIAPDELDGHDDYIQPPAWSAINNKFAQVKQGGRYIPANKTNKDTLVILVRYRDRRVHLKVFLNYMHVFLQRQNVRYVIYVIEMEAKGLFRHTTLINAGFLEVMKRENTSCMIIHDVDMLPVHAETLYTCDESVRHFVSSRHPARMENLSVSILSEEYTKSEERYFGGVVAYPTHHFRTVNGYSNLYSGWGGEDDDILRRLTMKGVPLTKERSQKGMYYVMSHGRQPVLENRMSLIELAESRMDKDGLNSVRYKLEVIEERRLFTWILITTKTPSCVYPEFEEEHAEQTKIGYVADDTVRKAVCQS